MVWSLWLTFESDGHWALGVTQDLLDDFPFQDQPEPKWSAGAGDDRGKVGAAELSNLGRVALVPISDLARILMFICINVFFLQRCCIVNCFPIPIIAITSLSAKHHSRSLFRKKERNLSLPEKNSLWSSRRWPGVPRWREKLSNWV